MMKTIVTTPCGPLLLMAQEGRLIYCNWLRDDCRKKQTTIEILYPEIISVADDALLSEAEKQLTDYFHGNRKIFHLPMKLTGTSFQRKVWKALQSISYGRTVSYKELASQIGNPGAVRAVAGACGANPLAVVIPCHRVVGCRGNIGGYTGGLDIKMRLLAFETVQKSDI